MPLPTTETLPEGVTIDAHSPLHAAAALLDAQQNAIQAVRGAAADIALGAELMASAFRGGKSVHYAAAGSSGLMALADASELRGTFGVPASSVHIHIAGGVPVNADMPGGTEDDSAEGTKIKDAIAPGDVVTVLTASGTTQFALAVAQGATSKGAKVIGVANNPGTPLLDMADVAICLETPPEVVAGSTRLGAGTAQKAALNLMSTLMGIALGHVYRGMMVNVVADNAKLVARSAGIVAHIADVSTQCAQDALAKTGGRTKPAILVAAGASVAQANDLLTKHNGQLGPCFASLNQT